MLATYFENERSIFSTELFYFSMEITLSDPLLSIKENTEENLGYQPRLVTIQGFSWLFQGHLLPGSEMLAG